MAIPDFQTLMLPLLKFVSDQKEHTSQEAIDVLALEFGLTEREKNSLLPREALNKSHMSRVAGKSR